MCRRLLLLICSLVLGAGPVHAQLALPGAAPTASGGATTSKPKKANGATAKGGASRAAKLSASAAPGVADLAGRLLLLNGGAGLLQISGDDKAVQIDRLKLAGEGVSDPSQRCVVDIVGEKPIVARSEGQPDGLERFQADVPACPFAFDILDGSVLVPQQISACVFKAADCQTNPSGLWGPDGASLEKDAADIAKERAQAEKAMGKLIRVIQDHAEDTPDAENLLRDQSGFAGQRDDACRDYVKESIHGFCAARMTDARTALLKARLEALAPEAAGKPEKKKKKPKEAPKTP